ncbi:MAG: hypothetical protein US60_C0026G0016 [Microgenomates group bacterium GW2011_GWC1_37_8]|uniref:Uncharacterized protein n=1 Tax=Candidatus Woesebacteria bacterium GW2011_GWB1_38_8 TaxID=1618570 RepID=A0A0G0L3U0_9BACT|nr:MAG: hypothetical protein US60_C0026G0016 [Microgenomates group bacterium GW2011_GWC1_37_8]KKQ85667.1 MAG: hypothetical protein UT08_C0005G0118 [Candidatus Woesebacteria bacterium GW2011_GWB1_38_8]
MRHYQKGFAHIILLLIVLLGSIASLFYFSWKNNLLKITLHSQDEVKKITEVIYEWEKVKPDEKTKDFGNKNKFGYIKLGKGELWVVNEDGTGEFLFQNEVSTSAAISPNGKYIAFLKGEGELMVQKIKGVSPSQPTKLTNIFQPKKDETKGVDTNIFAWSPDSTKIAFDVTFYPQPDADYSPKEHITPIGITEGIYYVDLINPEEAILLYKYKERIETYEIEERLMGWKPNSKEVIFWDGYNVPDKTVDITTKEIKVFRTDKTGQYNWNSLGDKLVYFDYEAKKIILEEKGAKKILAESITKDGKPVNLSQRPQFSPDGKYIIYHNSNYIEDNEELWLVDITKSNFPKILITKTDLNKIWHSGYWLSDSKIILYGIIDDTNVTKGFNIDLYLVSIENKIPHMIAEASYKPATSTSNTGLDN